MNRSKLVVRLFTLVLGVGFLYRGLYKTLKSHPQVMDDRPVAEQTVTKAVPAPGFYSSYKERDVEAARDQSEIAQVSVKEPKGFVRRLKMFRKYSRKVLKTEGEVHLLHALLADDATQNMALSNLHPATEENERIVIVDYLLAGLDEQKNLGRSALRDKVMGFLQTEVPRELDKKMIKSLAADRIELFAALLAVDPHAVEQLIAAPKSELNKRIYQYAMLNYGKRGG
ncbi:MAG: hypothetical protein ACXVA9_14075 [Bdellovibrionales bacterium]